MNNVNVNEMRELSLEEIAGVSGAGWETVCTATWSSKSGAGVECKLIYTQAK